MFPNQAGNLYRSPATPLPESWRSPQKKASPQIKRLACWLALLPLLTPALAAAQDTLNTVRFSGYGTLGLTWDDRRDMSPIRDISQLPKDIDTPRAGFASGPTARLDTRIGVQVDYRLNPQIEFVGQGVLRDHIATTLNNSIESAFVGLRPQANIDVRIGRLGYDYFLMADTRNLGYSYSWVRPPTEFYGWIPIFSLNGIDGAYQFDQGDAQWRLKAQAGNSRFSIPMGNSKFDFATDNLRSFSLTRQSGPWRQKLGYSLFTISHEAAPLQPLLNGLNQLANSGFPQINNEARGLRQELSFEGAKVNYLTVGGSYDDGAWIAQAEVGRTRSSADIVPHGRMGYIGVARRFGDWMPYLIASTIRPGNALRSSTLDWNPAGQSALQEQALRVVNTTRMSQDTLSLGVRWDFHNQMAMKLQWDTTRVNAYGYGLWFRDLDLVNRPSRINLLTVSLDFVF